ncbi:hypothetical protein DSECCO2_362920 [anaerobic digester metagenome]
MGFGIPSAERMALESTYEDTVTIQRMETVATGAIDKLVPVSVYSGQRCALSQKSDSSRQTAAQQDIEYDCILFVAPELKIAPGDTAAVQRLGTAENFEVVGRPVRYATHQEVFLKGRELS